MQMRNQNSKVKWKNSEVYLKNGGGVISHSFIYRKWDIEVSHAVWTHYLDFTATEPMDCLWICTYSEIVTCMWEKSHVTMIMTDKKGMC